MTPSEIRSKEVKEILKIVEEKRNAFFQLKLKAAVGQCAQNSELKKARRDIARMLTILKEKQKERKR